SYTQTHKKVPTHTHFCSLNREAAQYVHIHTHTHTHTHTHLDIITGTHTQTHKHKHTHTHTRVQGKADKEVIAENLSLRKKKVSLHMKTSLQTRQSTVKEQEEYRV